VAYLKPPALTRRLANPLVISRYREVAGCAVDSLFTKLPDTRDHPVFQIGPRNPAR
jgi:hypothetical protein